MSPITHHLTFFWISFNGSDGYLSLVEYRAEFIEWVSGNVEAEQFFS